MLIGLRCDAAMRRDSEKTLAISAARLALAVVGVVVVRVVDAGAL